jgi:hypothetical protein
MDTWVESKFIWINKTVRPGIVVAWKIYYNDSEGNEAVTAEKTFQIQPPPAPDIIAMDYEATFDHIAITWVTEFDEGDTVGVTCKVNGDSSKSCSYLGDVGAGGCNIYRTTSALYDFTPDPGGELKTVQNSISCTAYDPSEPLGQSTSSRYFYPLEFDVIVPAKIDTVVGQKTTAVVTVRNIGVLEDSYNVDMTASISDVLSITNGQQTIENIKHNENGQAYVEMRLMSSQTPVDALLTLTSVTSNTVTPADPIDFTATIPVKGSDVSLPDFGLFGLLRIMLSAALLVSFLF